jgi:MoaA/NifB/PqqE/SkfB family radical SAM enzyme
MPGIHDLALKARFGGANVNLLTNGTLLGEDDVEIMNHIGIAAVQIPILATDPEVHDHITGLPVSWAKAVNRFKNIGKMYLIAYFCIGKMSDKCVFCTGKV